LINCFSKGWRGFQRAHAPAFLKKDSKNIHKMFPQIHLQKNDFCHPNPKSKIIF